MAGAGAGGKKARAGSNAGPLRSLAWVLALTAIGGLIGALVAFSMPARYASTAEALADSRAFPTPVGNADGLRTLVDRQEKLIASDRFLGKVANRLHLDKNAEFNGGGGSGFDRLARRLQSLFPGAGTSAPHAADRATRQRLADSIDVRRIGNSAIIAITATTGDAKLSAEIANAVVAELRAEAGPPPSAAPASASSAGRLPTLRKAADEARRKAEAFRARNNLVDGGGRLVSPQALVDLNDRLAAAETDVAELKSRSAALASLDVDGVVAGALPKELDTPAMRSLSARYLALEQEHGRMALELGPRHPRLLENEAELADAKRRIRSELKRASAAATAKLRSAEALQAALAAQAKKLKAEQAALADKMVELHELERRAADARGVYEAALAGPRETAPQAGAPARDPVSVVSKATPAVRPLGPPRALVILIGALLGCLVGILAALARNVPPKPGAAAAAAGGRRGEAPRQGDAAAPQEQREEPGHGDAADELRGALDPFADDEPSSARIEPQAVTAPAAAADSSGEGEGEGTVRHFPDALEGTLRQTVQGAGYPHGYLRKPQRGTRPPAIPRQIADLRDSLREFRDAVNDLAQDKTRRKG